MAMGGEGGSDQLVIEFTPEELVVLGNALKLTLPLAEPASLAGDPGVRAALVDLARRSLVARRVLWTDGLEFVVVDPIGKLLDIVSEPGLVVKMARTDEVARFANRWAYESAVEDPLLLARPDVGVEVRSAGSGNVQLQPFVPARLLDRVASAAGLVERPAPPDVRAFDVAWDAAVATLRLVAAGRADAAVGSLLAGSGCTSRRRAPSSTPSHRRRSRTRWRSTTARRHRCWPEASAAGSTVAPPGSGRCRRPSRSRGSTRCTPVRGRHRRRRRGSRRSRPRRSTASATSCSSTCRRARSRRSEERPSGRRAHRPRGSTRDSMRRQSAARSVPSRRAAEAVTSSSKRVTEPREEPVLVSQEVAGARRTGRVPRPTTPAPAVPRPRRPS